MPQLDPVTHWGPYASPEVQQSAAKASAARSSASLPSSFDIRSSGDVTPVKDQGQCGSCWAFATMGSLESSILVAGGPARDFSENNLKDYHGFDWGPCEGGNFYISQAYLSRGSGPISESDDPYHPYDDRKTPAPNYTVQAYVRESLIFDTRAEMKTALMTYGALDTSLEWVDANYNSSNYTYYGTSDTSLNHDVTIVGWDDSKVTGAPTPGAWLIKNSWGSAWGNNGYFWLSYADAGGGKAGESFSDAVAPNPYDKVYYYDTYGEVSAASTPYGFNAFTATSADNLSAVQFWTNAENAGYDVRVYGTYSGGKLSGLLGETTGTEAYAGYHTVDLPSTVPLSAGQKFYVYVSFTNGGQYPMALDYAVQGYDSNSTAKPGESYYSSDGSNWNDVTSWISTGKFCIKALTSSTSSPSTPSTLSINSVSLKDGTSGTTKFNFTVTLSASSTQPVTVAYATADGTATAGVDYTAASGTLTFQPGQTQRTITVLVKGEKLHENDDTFSVNLSDASGATINSGVGTGTIRSAVAPPTVSIGNVSLKEGNSGTTAFKFVVSLSAASGAAATVQYATADAAATTADSDYVAASGTLTFAPGQTKQTITVAVNGDTKYEANETFTVNLSSPAGANIATGKGTGTIQNDDKPPVLTIGNATATQQSGSAVVTVTLSPASGVTALVKYATASGTAKAGLDFTATLGTLTFAPGQTTETIAVPILSDPTAADPETFLVKLSAPKQATLGTKTTGTGTIQKQVSASLLAGLTAARANGSSADAQQSGQAADQAIRLLMLTEDR